MLRVLAGLELTFFCGVYGTSVGNNEAFGVEKKGLIGLCGIFIGVGEILGDLLYDFSESNNDLQSVEPRKNNISMIELQQFKASKKVT